MSRICAPSSTNFVIHGKEPAGAAPFVRVAQVEVRPAAVHQHHHIFDITYLGVQQPQVNVIVLPDGTTNIPVAERSRHLECNRRLKRSSTWRSALRSDQRAHRCSTSTSRS